MGRVMAGAAGIGKRTPCIKLSDKRIYCFNYNQFYRLRLIAQAIVIPFAGESRPVTAMTTNAEFFIADVADAAPVRSPAPETRAFAVSTPASLPSEPAAGGLIRALPLALAVGVALWALVGIAIAMI
jgi:hypothetical protein